MSAGSPVVSLFHSRAIEPGRLVLFRSEFGAQTRIRWLSIVCPQECFKIRVAHAFLPILDWTTADLFIGPLDAVDQGRCPPDFDFIVRVGQILALDVRSEHSQPCDFAGAWIGEEV